MDHGHQNVHETVVIKLCTGISSSADIWSVGCSVIEMATGKAPWSQQYQEVAALFYVRTTKSHPPIPDHLSAAGKGFLLKCLQKEPDLRASRDCIRVVKASICNRIESGLPSRSSQFTSDLQDSSGKRMAAVGAEIKKLVNLEARSSCNGLRDVAHINNHQLSSECTRNSCNKIMSSECTRNSCNKIMSSECTRNSCNKIMHRDIKGPNILVDNKGCIKLADFGASKKRMLACNGLMMQLHTKKNSKQAHLRHHLLRIEL